MFVEEIRRAVMAAPRGRLAEISGAVWKGFAAGAIGENEAQQLAELIEAKKAIPVAPAQSRRRHGIAPTLTGEHGAPAALDVVGLAAAAARGAVHDGGERGAGGGGGRGEPARPVPADHRGDRGPGRGVQDFTVRNALRQAQALGVLTSEEWRITAWRNAPNTVKVVSKEWSTWIRLRARRAERSLGGGSKSVNPTNTHIYKPATLSETARKREVERGGGRFGSVCGQVAPR